MDAGGMDDADEYMWTAPPFSSSSSLQKGLQDFEGSLRCPICGELFDVPVSIVTCHHTFCSKCIRDAFRSSIRSMKRSADCPVCREAVETGGADFKCLVPNRTVGNLVKQFRTFRSELRDQLAQVVQGSSSVSGTDSARTNVGAQPPREKRENADELSVRRKKKPKTFYKGLKLKQLKKLCADEGLSTVGTDAELRARHEEFILCYNAESDSYTPRSAAEIARQVARREEARKVEARKAERNGAGGHVALMGRLKESRQAAGKTDKPSKLSSGNKAFDMELNSNFRRLIEEAKKQKISQAGNATAKSSSVIASYVNETEAMNDSEKAKASNQTENNNRMKSELSNETGKVASTTKRTSLSVATALDGTSELTESPVSSGSHNFPSLSSTSSSSSSSCSSGRKRARPETRRGVRGATDFTVAASPDPTHGPTHGLGRERPALRKSSRARNTKPSIVGPWQCSLCTYINKKRTWMTARCEMCESPRVRQKETVTLE